ncbi:type VII secretion protein EccCb [Mycobacterium kubicae]|uniref:type VII secretion protein EccCb n=1 Tax=Mycobacterium kubicae TaxID=120959 RepID=UPI0007FD5BDA|nr:type VII secretion protein EccCb [Mycobacterium kubicae]OBK52454.1 type VII secretion protein EccCb [Mycobacterium kubicae]
MEHRPLSADIEVAAPPEVPRPTSSGLLLRVLPVVMSVATFAVMAVAWASGSSMARNPTFLAFPVMMLGSLVASMFSGRACPDIDADRVNYLDYLSGLRRTVAEIAARQRFSLEQAHPDPDTLWPLIGGSRRWERRPDNPEFCRIRVGRGNQPLATRLVAPPETTAHRSDPVTGTALARFLRAHSTVDDVPVAIPLRDPITIEGAVAAVRALARSMVCQLAVLHSPDEVLIAAVACAATQEDWDWLKWLPHNRRPCADDATVPMVYSTLGQADTALAELSAARVVVITDTDERGNCGGAVTTIRVAGSGGPLTVRVGDEIQPLVCPDQMSALDALVCARRLATHHGRPRAAQPGWDEHDDQLRVRIGVTPNGVAVELDIKESAEGGMGPHGLCVGATGSGKSELLRTVAVGLMARNSPAVLNLLLVDFKGGATFLDLAAAPHVCAVVTNLAEEAPLVARMKDALTGEIHRRQRLLRSAGNFVSTAAYERARRGGAALPALPTLFIIVDEFAELLSQHPDFADTFVAIGRLGRSLGMHLLLASQRLEEGRLRGLEAHLSYRVCLKTLLPSDSRTVLGTTDAYELPNTPGAGLLRSASGELTRFQTSYVSAPLAVTQRDPAADEVRLFTSRSVHRVPASTARRPTVARAVLDRLSGQGPPAHRVWLPPLDTAPAVSELLSEAAPALTVPIGIVDRPFEQRRTPLIVDLSGAAGNVAIVGGPQSGKSTALRTLLLALAATHDADDVHCYCLDFGGGALASMGELPHVGTVAGRADRRLVRRMVAQLEAMVRDREAHHRGPGTGGRFPEVFLVIDGWGVLRQEFEALEEPVTALAAQGLSYGVHVVLSATRWAEVRPALKDQIGTRIELRLGDPADSEVDRKQAQRVPHNRAGRGLSHDGLQMLIALPQLSGADIRCGTAGSGAPPIPLLPDRVEYEAVLQRASHEVSTQILLGIDERRLRPVALDFQRQQHLLVLGDNACGKTSLLRLLCRELIRTRTAGQAELVIVDFRRTLLSVAQCDHLGGYAMSPAALTALLPSLVARLQQRMPPADVTPAQLQTRSWWSGPDIYLLVDDYDLVAAPAGNPLAVLLDYLPYAADVGLHVIVARRSGGAARALFEPLLAGLRELGCLGLLMSASPDDGVLLGSSNPGPLPPGRAVLTTRTGDEQVVQLAWSPPP